MSNRRERLFECTFLLGAEESRMAFRAWSAEEALRDVDEVLARAGVLARGEVVVRDARGRVVLRGPARSTGDAVGAA